MKKEAFEIIKKEAIYLGLLILLALAIFKIAFFREDLLVLSRTVLSLFWLFVIPGYVIMLYWSEKLGFVERFVIGIFVSASVVGILSYYLGLIGLNIKYHAVVLPIVLILSGIALNFKRFSS
ncbi:hypothetical protein HYU09_04870 [Candidatus Woesearchaeota archaeon]|nr:hypothetical protein [Candidatus Woesearchaeota archaeon]